MKKLYFLLLLLITVACGVVSEYNAPVFPKTETITEEALLADSLPFRVVSRIYSEGDYLIIRGMSNHNCFNVYEKSTGKLVKSFYAIGKGPFEGMYPNLFPMGNGKYFITENNLRKYIFLDFYKMLNGEEDYFEEVKFNSMNFRNVYGAKDVNFMSENKMLISSDDFAGRFFTYDLKNKSAQVLYNDVPKVDADSSQSRRVITHLSKSRFNPSKTKCVTATYLGEIIEVFDVKEDKFTLKNVSWQIEPKYRFLGPHQSPMPIEEETVYGVSGIFTTENNIYTLRDNSKSVENRNKTIAVYDWDIKPIAEYTYDNKNILCFTYCEEDKKIYAVVKDNETKESQIVRIDADFVK